MHDADVVADVLELAQVVRGDEHCRPVLCYVGEDDAPDLAAHHGIESVNRFVEQHDIGAAADGKPENRLLLHAFGEVTDLTGRIDSDKCLAEPLEEPFVEPPIKTAVEIPHVEQRSGREIEELVGDEGDALLDGVVVPNGLTIDGHGTLVRTVDAHHVAEQRRFAGAVGSDEAVDAAARHMDARMVERRKVTELLNQSFGDYHPVCSLRHFAPPSCRACAASIRALSSVELAPKYSSSATVWSSVCRSSSRRWVSTGSSSETKEPLPGTL